MLSVVFPPACLPHSVLHAVALCLLLSPFQPRGALANALKGHASSIRLTHKEQVVPMEQAMVSTHTHTHTHIHTHTHTHIHAYIHIHTHSTVPEKTACVEAAVGCAVLCCRAVDIVPWACEIGRAQ